ncbi:MAG TPA: TetR/AcrR family transcriptional regulator [Propionibacteriaceae bacterium]|nr:TetR/AcrR family transcriptional regulator [Propionibacteriaceae bacterium]
MDDVTAEVELPESLRRLWSRAAAPAKERRTSLSLDRIVSAAIEIADAEGLSALSMARLADRLGSAPMSLYRHVSSKEELYDFMIDAAAGELGAAVTNDWRAGLTAWLTDLMAIYRRHPWILQLPLTRPPLEPGQLDWLERGLLIQQATPLTNAEKMGIVLTLMEYARGHAAIANSLEGADASFGLPLPYGQLLARLVDKGRYPMLTAAVDAGVFEPPADPETDLREDFQFGLNLILDGLAALIRSKA